MYFSDKKKLLEINKKIYWELFLENRRRYVTRDMNRILYRQRGSFRTQRYDLLEFNVTSFSFERSKDPHFLCCLLPLSFSSVSHSSSSTCWILFLALIIFPLAFVRIYAECCYCSIFVLPYLFRANKITVTQPELFFGIKEYFKQIFTIRK